MAENKFTNYLLYAIGEIILIVIGILISIQINNLNEEQKLKLELEELKASLISDLNKDVTSISEELDLLISDTTKLDEYFKRMSGPAVTIDTLIQIYSSEFIPTIYGAISFNDNTINSLKYTGNFSHLERMNFKIRFKSYISSIILLNVMLGRITSVAILSSGT